MQVTNELKEKIAYAIEQDFIRKNKSGTMTYMRHANILNISPSVYSRLKNGTMDRLLSDGEWVRLHKWFLLDKNGNPKRIAKTKTFEYITTQLEVCKSNQLSGIFCDMRGIGKTTAAKVHALNNADVAYVDGSNNKAKRDFIRSIAKAFGFSADGKLRDVYNNMISGIMVLNDPQLIIDEAGDLSYESWLERKAIYNSLDGICSFYTMGANGLRDKIERNINNNKVGYEEMYDRDGGRFQSMTEDKEEPQKAIFLREEAEIVLRTELPNINRKQANDILNAAQNNLRRLDIEIFKYKNL